MPNTKLNPMPLVSCRADTLFIAVKKLRASVYLFSDAQKARINAIADEINNAVLRQVVNDALPHVIETAESRPESHD